MNGILLIDKEQGWTSNDAVSKLRGILKERRIGHAGTLDPMATGLLTVFVGRATRAVEFAESHDKRYIAGLRLGIVTDTQDIEGRVLSQCDFSCTEDELRTAAAGFLGQIEQIPPMYSAIKINGQRLYDIARKGGEVERKPRKLRIDDISILSGGGADWLLDISCSKGTYIRTLCHDIGQSLGCGGCMSSLRRISAGDFSVDSAHSLAQVQKAADEGRAESLLIPVDTLFSQHGEYTADAKQEKRLRCGNEFFCSAGDGLYRVYSESGEFLMLGRAEGGSMKTVKSFFEVT